MSGPSDPPPGATPPGGPSGVRAGRAPSSRFAIPSGRALDVIGRLDDAGLGLARARVAARLGDPDPFHVRAALALQPDALVAGGPGEPLTADAAQAALVTAALERGAPDEAGLAGLFAFQPPGPKVRAIPVDRDGPGWLRWRGTSPAPPRPGTLEEWSTEAIGDAAVATVRIITPIPGGVALGSDYGLTLWTRDGFTPFPWPRGSRREARRVEAMAATADALLVGTSQALYTWDHRSEPRSRKHGPDGEEGYDDLLALLSVGEKVYAAYRTHLEGGDGPADALCLAADPHGVVYAGTRQGVLHVVDGGPIRSFVDGKGRPVRHLAWADGALFVAAAGALHRFDGTRWSVHGPEPGALCTDSEGRLWAVVEGGLAVWWQDRLHRVDAAVERPWSLGASSGALWIGGVGRVWRLQV